MTLKPTTTEDEPRERNWYVLVYGIPRPSEPIVLAPGVSLLPLPAPLDLFDLMALGSAGFHGSGALEPFLRGCTCEIESAADSAIEPGFNTLNRAWLAVTLLVLQGFSWAKGVAVSRYRWQDVPIPEKSSSWTERVDPKHRLIRTNLPPFEGGLLDIHHRIISVFDSPREIDESHARWLQSRFPVANSLAGDSGFYLALCAANDWRFSADHRSAIARLWSGIESIFGISSELVFRISLLASCLLEPRGESRLDRFKDVKKLYGARSKAVHGDALSEDKMRDATRDSFVLLRDLLLLSLNRGHVLGQQDFDDAVFH